MSIGNLKKVENFWRSRRHGERVEEHGLYDLSQKQRKAPGVSSRSHSKRVIYF